MTGGPAPPAQPTVLRSLGSAVLLDRRGDVELLRETRGALVDWGGIYGQLVRLSGPWKIEIDVPGGTTSLPGSLASATVAGELYESHHTFGPVELVQRIVPLRDLPGAVRTVRLRTSGPDPVGVRVRSTLEPFLLPVLVEGIRPVSFELELSADRTVARHRGFAFSFRSSTPVVRLLRDGETTSPGRYRGPVGTLGHEHRIELASGASVELSWELLGGVEHEVRTLLEAGRGSIPDPAVDQARLASDEQAWEATTPILDFPDAPWLTEAYATARTGLRRLFARPTPEFTGLVAGFPWYAAIWCRDVAWMVPALVWLGDLDWAERTVSTVLRFQARGDVPVVGGEAGELPMQVSPGPIFFYGTSDTTLYFPTLARRLLCHGAEPSTVAGWTEALARAVAWGERRTDPATGLLRNGGEAAELETATGSLARVRYGIDAQDTTIWDSADRRDHAVDVQVLWYEALRSAEALGLRTPTEPRLLADRLARTLPERYRWPQERYLFDSVRGGEPVAHVRPNALRAVSAGLISAGEAVEVVRRAAEPDLSSPWGVRTLSSSDPEYDPHAYHGGQVWPIATAWAADAAFAVGLSDLGVGYLRTIADGFSRDGGQANECYRGDRPEPFDSCFLLGLSLGPFLATVFERLWGLSVDAREPALDVRPRFPPAWRRASIGNLRIGPGRAALRWEEGTLTVGWVGPRPLSVRTAGGAVAVTSGASVAVPGSATP